MHGIGQHVCLLACLHRLKENVETKGGKVPPCYLRAMARGLTNADP